MLAIVDIVAGRQAERSTPDRPERSARLPPSNLAVMTSGTVLAAPDVPAAADAIDLADQIVDHGVPPLAASWRARRRPGARLRHRPRRGRSRDGQGAARLRRQGRPRGPDHLRLHRRHAPRPVVEDRSAARTIGASSAIRWRQGARVRPAVPRPRLPRRARRSAGPAPSRQRHGHGRRLVRLVRPQRDRPARRARAPDERRRPRGDRDGPRRTRRVRAAACLPSTAASAKVAAPSTWRWSSPPRSSRGPASASAGR